MHLGAETKEELIDEAVRRFGLCFEDILLPVEIIRIYDAIQPDNDITVKQVEASLAQVVDTTFCVKDELIDVLQDLDRRNFLLRDLKWEFQLLDHENSGSIPKERGYFLFCAVHGRSRRYIWEKFLFKRALPDSRISFEELSVILCDILIDDDDM